MSYNFEEYVEEYEKQLFKGKINLGKNVRLPHTKDGKWRTDVEVMNWNGNIHVQNMQNDKLKYLYNYNDKKFYDLEGNKAPKSVQNLTKDAVIIKNLKTAANLYLDITKHLGD